jgi:hypothetical protein
MGLESGTYISDLIATNPAGTDQRYTTDDHIRLIKAVLKNTFPNLNGPVQMTPDLLNSVKVSPVSITGNYNVTAADHGKVIYANANAGAITVTFASAAALGAGFQVTVIKTDSSANTITLDPSGTETVNGSSTLTLSAPMEMAEIHYNSDTALQVGKPPTIIPTGSKVIFAQASAPTGWTQDASMNDRVLRVVSGAGGAQGGSWVISGLSSAAYALTINDIPAHGHPYQHKGGIETSSDSGSTGGILTGTLGGTYTAPAYSGPPDDATGHAIGGTGGGAAHAHSLSHDGSWRPAYVDVIVCTKN